MKMALFVGAGSAKYFTARQTPLASVLIKFIKRTKTVVCENRNGIYIEVFEYGKRSKALFAGL